MNGFGSYGHNDRNIQSKPLEDQKQNITLLHIKTNGSILNLNLQLLDQC